MNSKEFIESINSVKPDSDLMIELDYTSEEIEEVKNTYELCKINNADNKYPDLSELGYLFSNYKLSDLELGFINFIDIPIKHQGFYIIGKIECDILVYSVITDTVFVKENSNDNVLWKCSNGISSFLDALIIMANHYSKVIINDNLYDDFEYLKSVANEASNKSGGEQYLSFYQMLLGI